MGVQVDLDDEVAPADSLTVPHTGCLEIKVLKGTDGRAYTLEAMRITPRDANYVKVTDDSCLTVFLSPIIITTELPPCH